MKNDSTQSRLSTIFSVTKGSPEVPAEYRSEDSVLPEHRTNALIRALKAPCQSVGEALARLSRKPQFDMLERDYGLADRTACVDRLDGFWIPSIDHAKLYFGMYNQVVRALALLDPSTPEGQALLHGRTLQKKAGSMSMLVGTSGMGKSTLLSIIMQEIANQFIRHSGLPGAPLTDLQVTYLRRNIPERCTPRTLGESSGLALDHALGTQEFAQAFKSRNAAGTVHSMELGRLLVELLTAIFILDEFQNLSLVGVGSKSVLAMLINLHDEFPIPIHVVGTHKALKVPKDDASFARRIAQSGYFELKRPLHGKDPVWQQRCKLAWKYSWVRNPEPYSEEIGECLYGLTGGVTGIMLTLLKSAQKEAMYGSEQVDIALLREVFNDQMRLLRQPVAYLLSGDPALMLQFDDLYFDAMPKPSTDENASFPYGEPSQTAAGGRASSIGAQDLDGSERRGGERPILDPKGGRAGEPGQKAIGGSKPLAGSSPDDVAKAFGL